jgi:hypothetical protein
MHPARQLSDYGHEREKDSHDAMAAHAADT